MIEIKSAAPDTVVVLCEQAAVAADDVLEMLERETRLGFACMTYSGEEVTLTYLNAPDAPLTDALLRAALNAARSKGAKTACIADEALIEFMQTKAYLQKTSDARLEIAGFFAKSVCKA